MAKVVWVSDAENKPFVDRIRCMLPDVKIISGEESLRDTRPDAMVFTYSSEKDVERIVREHEDVPAAVQTAGYNTAASRWGYLGTDLTISNYWNQPLEDVLPKLLQMGKSFPGVIKIRRGMRGLPVGEGKVDQRTAEACFPWKENTYAAWTKHVFSDNGFIKRIQQVVEGRPVVELGPGTMGGLPWELLHLGAVSYVGVDPFNCPDKQRVVDGRNNMLHPIPRELRDKIEYKPVSALKYLESLQGGRKVVTVSSAVLTDAIFRETHRDYAVETARHIIRVGFQGPTAIHTVDPFFEGIFKEEGFNIVGTKDLGGRNKLHIYSKR